MTQYSRYHQWHDVDRNEMKVFLSLVMLMGIIKKNNYKDYWSTDPLIQTPIFNKAKSVNRFVNILGALHFFDNLQGYITNSVGKNKEASSCI